MAEKDFVKSSELDKLDSKTIIIQRDSEEKNVVYCDMCGHANPENTTMCKMCSNYLEGMK